MKKQIYAIAWFTSLRPNGPKIEGQGEFCFNSLKEVYQCIKGYILADRNSFIYHIVSRGMSVDDCVQIAAIKKQITWS